MINDEVAKFDAMSGEWWDEHGAFKTLHEINPIRIQYIKQNILAHSDIHDISLVDIGCGGGILSEPLSRLGAKVKGIDLSPNNIEAAKKHAAAQGLDIDYECVSVEDPVVRKQKFDVVVCMEVLEHVDNYEDFLYNCSKLLNKNGLLFISTINRNIKSYGVMILGAEYITRKVAVGTHSWDKFLKPSEVERALVNHNMMLMDINGMQYNPLKNKEWFLSENIDVNCIMCFKRYRYEKQR